MSRIMFANQDALTADDLCRYAQEIGLDVDRFIEDFRSPRANHRIEEDQLDAEVMDLHSTPTFFVGGHRHVGPWDSRTLIRSLEASADRRVEPSP